MKVRGKEININCNKNYKVRLGTVNNNNPECVYFNIKGWVTPKEENELDYGKIVRVLNKRIKSQLHNILGPTNFVRNFTLVDTDLRESGIRYGKKSYFNCEVTLYQKELKQFDELPQDIEEITRKVIKDTLEPFEYFKFTSKK
jgi:hypothetical protein